MTGESTPVNKDIVGLLVNVSVSEQHGFFCGTPIGCGREKAIVVKTEFGLITGSVQSIEKPSIKQKVKR